MRILAFSDLHLDIPAAKAVLAAAPEVDLVIGAGDFASRHEGLVAYMAHFRPLEAKALFVPGNNETEADLRAATGARVLHGEAVEFGGLTILGLGCAVPPLPPLPWQSFDMSEAQAEAILGGIGRADILISHSPPKGVSDVLKGRGSIGSEAVHAAALRLQPRLLLCGHVHDSWGQEGWIGATRVVNLGPTPNFFEVGP